MRKIPLFLLVAMLFSLPCFAVESAMVFCESINEKFEPINPGNEFKGSSVSWIATAKSSYGIPQLTVSVYRHEGSEEALVLRRNIDINPEWNTTGVRNMPLPSEGEYTVALTTPTGEAIGKGRVKLVKVNGNAKPAKEETLGAKLQMLYERYAPK